MSDKLNIEELFRSNLGSMEADVSPNAWSNIQQGINASAGATSAAAAKTGLSFIAKSIIVSTGIVAATIAGIYLFNNDQPQNNSNDAIVAVDDNQLESDEQTKPLTDHINDGPVIVDNVLNDHQTDQGQQTIAPLLEPVDLFDPVDPDVHVEAGSVGEVGQDNNGDADNNTQVNGRNASEDENSGQEVSALDKQDNGSEERAPVQKLITANPAFTVLTDNNEAPATYAFVSNAENCSKVRWDFGDGTTAEGFEVEHTYEKPGKYNVQMIASEGQQNRMKTIVMNVQSIAKIAEVNSNIFSPNGDGLNDNYFIESENIEELAIIITDSKGNIIWRSNEIHFNWNGTDLGGNPLPSGNYSYVLVAVGTDGGNIERRGFITLER